MFIVLEGADGVGKSTQARQLAATLEERGYCTMVVQDPGHTRLGRILRELLKDKTFDMRPVSQAFLFAAARAETAQVVAQHLEAGGVAIADRWTLSSYVYQGYVQGVDLSLVKHMADAANCGLVPDLTILLDMDVEEAYRRRHHLEVSIGSCNSPGSAACEPLPEADRYESQGLSFQQSLRDAYLRLARTMPNVQILPVDGYAVKSVHDQILELCQERLPAIAEIA